MLWFNHIKTYMDFKTLFIPGGEVTLTSYNHGDIYDPCPETTMKTRKHFIKDVCRNCEQYIACSLDGFDNVVPENVSISELRGAPRLIETADFTSCYRMASMDKIVISRIMAADIIRDAFCPYIVSLLCRECKHKKECALEYHEQLEVTYPAWAKPNEWVFVTAKCHKTRVRREFKALPRWLLGCENSWEAGL